MNRFKQYFTFTKSERNGTLVLLLIILLAIFYPEIESLFVSKKKTDFSEFKKQIDEFEKEAKGDSANKTSTDTTIHLFYFNPNKISEQQWLSMGISQSVATIVQHYLAKGGQFHSASDLKKIYGFKEEDYNRLAPYVKIDNEKSGLIDINKADSATLVSLKGIGPVLSSRIIVFRNKLGGFFKTEQLMDVSGLQASTFNQIKEQITLSKPAINLISVNTSTEADLGKNPYLPYAMAHAIVTYRAQHGNYSKLSDIKKCGLIYDELYNKIAPYLSL